MKNNLILLLVGSFIGLSVGGVLGGGYIYYKSKGRSFENLSELRSSISSEKAPEKKERVQLKDILDSHPSNKIIYTLKPNLDIVFQGVQVTTNSFGMRNRETTLEKPENTFRIALIGDSFAFGWGVDQDKTFAVGLEELLNRHYQGNPKIEVLNFGIPGYSTFQEVALFEEKALPFSPDISFVFFVDNDFGLPFFIRSAESSDSSLKPMTFIHKMLKSESKEERKEALELQGYVDPNNNLKHLENLSKAHGFDIVMALNPRRSVDYDIKRLWYLKQSTTITHIPMREKFLAWFKKENLTKEQITLKGDPHPNALRHGKYAEILSEGFIPVIDKRIR